eukprot:237497-Prymnesium_polylepis.1
MRPFFLLNVILTRGYGTRPPIGIPALPWKRTYTSSRGMRRVRQDYPAGGVGATEHLYPLRLGVACDPGALRAPAPLPRSYLGA